jgi:hypothetical protein
MSKRRNGIWKYQNKIILLFRHKDIMYLNQLLNQKTMKKLSLIFTVVMGLFLTLNVKAQDKPDYFVGRWAVVVMGTPNGDSKMNLVIERKDGKLTGTVRDTTDKEMSKITTIDEKDKTITAAFTVQSYDVTLTLEPMDDDHVKGSLMGMFDAKGVRVKETDPAKK